MAAFDVRQFVEQQRFRPLHAAILLVGVMVMFIDGFDIFMIGKIAPAIAKDFGQSPAALTPLFVTQQIGLSIGAFATPPFADRIGRKRMLEICAAMFGLLTIAGVWAPSIMVLAILRGLAGLFLAGVVPMVLALVTEFMPARGRAAFVSVALVGYSLGNAGGGLVAAWLLDIYGWRSGFWVGGVGALACLPLLWLIPESIQFRVARNAADPRIPIGLRRIDPALRLSGDERFELGGEPSMRRARLGDLWRDDRTITILFWIASFLSMGTITLLAAWLPSFFQQMAGIPIQRFAVTAMVGFLGGIIGILTIGRLMDRFAAPRVLTGFYLTQGAAIALIGIVPFASPVFLPVMMLWSFAQGGGQAGLNMFIARSYPIGLRSTGLGWAGGAGRIAGIVAPLFGGLALAQHFPLAATLAAVAIGPWLIALVMLALARKARGRHIGNNGRERQK